MQVLRSAVSSARPIVLVIASSRGVEKSSTGSGERQPGATRLAHSLVSAAPLPPVVKPTMIGARERLRPTRRIFENGTDVPSRTGARTLRTLFDGNRRRSVPVLSLAAGRAPLLLERK